MPRARRRDLLSKRVLRLRQLASRAEARASPRDPRPTHPRYRRAEARPHRRDRRSRQSRPARGIRARGGMAASSGSAGQRDGDPRQSRRLCAAASRARHGAMASLYAGQWSGAALFTTPPTLAFPSSAASATWRIVALSSAVPTMPLIAAGKLGSHAARPARRGADALGREEPVPRGLDPSPPFPGQASWRRGLRDAGRTPASCARRAPSSCCMVTITSRPCASSNGERDGLRRRRALRLRSGGRPHPRRALQRISHRAQGQRLAVRDGRTRGRRRARACVGMRAAHPQGDA